MTDSKDTEETGTLRTVAADIRHVLSERGLGRTIVGLVIGVALLIVAVWGVDLRAIWQVIQRAEPLWIGLALLGVLITLAPGPWYRPWSKGAPSLHRLPVSWASSMPSSCSACSL